MTAPTAGRLAFALTVAAAAWALALVAAAFVAPVYERSSPGADTVVAVNGLGAAGVAAAPLLAAAIVWWALRRACARPATRARAWAWTVALALLASCLATGFTIGMFALPVALALCGACAVTPTPVRRA